MSLQQSPLETARSEHPLTAELAAVVAALVALSVWQHVARAYVVPAVGFTPGGPGFDAVDSLLVAGVVTGGILLAGAVAVVGAYVAVRDLDVGLALPAARRPAVVAVAAPLALVVATKLVGVLTGTAYGTLLQRSYGAAATVEHFATMTALTLLVGVPTLLLVCQVVVQGSVRRVVGGDVAVAVTTLLAGFLLVDATGGPSTLPEPGRLVGAALFVVAVAAALYGLERFERPWLRYLSVAPVVLLVGGTAVAGIAAVGTVSAVLFVGVKVAVLAVAALTYERTDSLLAPALTYACFLAASEAVVFFLEAGVGSA